MVQPLPVLHEMRPALVTKGGGEGGKRVIYWVIRPDSKVTREVAFEWTCLVRTGILHPWWEEGYHLPRHLALDFDDKVKMVWAQEPNWRAKMLCVCERGMLCACVGELQRGLYQQE
jgi:hypothetical protein